MKILQVFDIFSPQHGGGTVDVIRKLSEGLTQKGHDVTICTSDYKLDNEYIKSLDGVNVFSLPILLSYSGLYLMPSANKFDVSQFNVIHLHCYRSFLNVAICHSARKYKIPYIIDAHGSTVKMGGLKQTLKSLYDEAFGYKDLAYSSRAVAETEVGVSEYLRLNVPSNKIVIIHAPFDIQEFENLPQRGIFRQKYNIKEKYIVLFIGRINKIKGLEFLVNAFLELRLQDIDVRLVFVGTDDGYKDKLERLINIHALQFNVTFTGQLSDDDKLSALVDADVLVQPSLYEAGARPSFEAILCGIPTIVTRNTGAGEDIEKIDAGYLVHYGNVPELSQMIKHVLYNEREAQFKTQKAKAYIKNNLSLETIVDKYENLYQEITNK